MQHSRNLFGKRKYLLGLMLLVFVAVVCVAFSTNDGDDFDISRREVLLRRIGHELLLQSGDSTSRVLPVKRISGNEYQIAFENDFSFEPDSLINVTKRLLDKDPLTNDYVVKVMNCANSSMVYGYAISKDRKDNIITCNGRKQPKGCYLINIKFKPTVRTIVSSGYFLTGLSFLALVGFIFLRSAKQKRALPDIQHANTFTLGSVLFDAKNRKLIINEKTLELTGTETRVLLIFASSPNQTIERSRLQKEIWEDEGVIVGRSLDMFISKLRKKLERDPNIKIVVIRGKGYKLEIAA
ncbi:winged helix-turn-helix domain-containing protein [Flavobacterium wongokense]|uniref:winged helix-turn-helix domain-containing protein n=1 Tax=Flavobacterium wongokense TaxID=2910674 RepID=UPI001F1B7EE6|nr:winged helix-turn-helix domain-containing protein [Flavobacterium sp. WG47]MCF6131222.1 winged helix-turn-helix domain-containing protein [Flavobacterium sp. WG47]